jgi:broad specificity phosphatase PhoE
MPLRTSPVRSGPQIILCRHEETALNTGQERIRGWQNIPLDDVGLQRGRGLAQDVAEHQPRVIFSSDLQRAIQTAKLIEQALPYKIHLVPLQGLRPWNVGDLTGQTIEAVKPELLRLLKAKTEQAPGGESYVQFAQRFVDEFVKVSLFARKLGRPVCVVTHSRDCRAVRVLVDGGIRALIHQEPGKVLLSDEDPIEPGGHAVLQWSGGRWIWDDNTDTVHSASSSWQSGRSQLR